MKIKLSTRWGRVYSAIGGVLIGALAFAPPTIPQPMEPNTYTNCPSPLAGCNVYGEYQYKIDPFCCSEDATSCAEYSVEVWTCAAGATRYRNFVTSWGPTAGWTCGSGPGCY